MVIGVLWSERPQMSNILCDSALTKWTRWVALFFNVNWSVRYVKPVWSSTSLWFAPYKIHAQSLWCLFLTQPLTILAFINIYCLMFLTIQTLYFLWAFLLIARSRNKSRAFSVVKFLLQKTAFSLIKSRLALGSPGWSVVLFSQCKKWPNIQGNRCWLPDSDYIDRWYPFPEQTRPGMRNNWSFA